MPRKKVKDPFDDVRPKLVSENIDRYFGNPKARYRNLDGTYDSDKRHEGR